MQLPRLFAVVASRGLSSACFAATSVLLPSPFFFFFAFPLFALSNNIAIYYSNRKGQAQTMKRSNTKAGEKEDEEEEEENEAGTAGAEKRRGRGFRRLPPELQLFILSFLPSPDLCRCGMVSRRWHSLAKDPSLWKDRPALPSHVRPSGVAAVEASRSADMAAAGMYRLVMLGPGGCGRNSFIVRYVTGTFVTSYDPVIEDSYRKQTQIDETPALLDLLVTAGQEEYSALRDQYAKTGEGFFILYSITSRASFEAIPGYVRSILRAKDCDLSECPPIIILGNKTDMNDARQVSMDEGKAMADQLLTYRWRHHPRFSSPSSARAKLEEEEEREDKKNNNKKKKKKRKSKKKRGFVFRHNFFETSVKNDTVTFYGAPDKPVESHHGALIVDELVRQVDEWRLNQVMGKEGVVERDKNKHNNDSNGKCLLM
ncbi:RAS1 protein [Balamuthia mandrillaris]